MKKVTYIVLPILLFAFCLTASAQQGVDASLEKELKTFFKGVDGLWAKKDAEGLARLFAEKHSIVFPDGKAALNIDPPTFAQMHGGYLNSPPMAESRIRHEVKNVARITDEVAIVHLLFTEVGGGPKGQQMETATVRKFDDGWKIVALHITNVMPAPEQNTGEK